MRKLLKQELFNDLRKRAYSIYSTQQDLIHVINSVSINAGKVALLGTAENMWDSVLSYAESQQKLPDLIQFIKGEYPEDEVFGNTLLAIENNTAFIEEVDHTKYITPASVQSPKVLLLYDQEDDEITGKLKDHLFPFELAGTLAVEDMYEDLPGMSRQEIAMKKTGEACVVLLLLSPRFFKPRNGCLQLALAAFDMKKTVVPVLIAESLWGRIQVLNNIVPLPLENKPVSEWQSEDKALLKIAEGVERVVKRIKC